jgi:Undecaprenyl-phosphate glucose phosphotransferase
LISARTRQSRRLGAHQFRAADVTFIVFVVLTIVAEQSSASLLETSTVDVMPFVLGGYVLARMLRSLGLYRFERSGKLALHLLQVLTAAVAAGLVVAGTSAGLHALADSKRSLLGWAAAWTAFVAIGLLLLHLTWALLVRRWRSQGLLTPTVVIIGATPQAEQLIGESIVRRDLHVLGVFDDRLARSPRDVLGVPVLGTTEALLTHRITPFVDLIVVAVDPTATTRVRELTARLAILPNEVTLIVEQGDPHARAAARKHLADAPLAPLTATVDADRKAFAKRMQDLLIGVPVMLVALPFLVLIGLAVRLGSRGPVLFRQRRHGFNNEEIVVWKFRTMRHACADARAEQQVTSDDQRITRIGRLLRSTSLDELPQLINVIRGEMSLVGPRPHAIGMKTGDVESALLVAEYAHRHRIKPGMTGWAAVNGSRGPLHEPDDVRKRVVLDVEYINRQSFWFDLQIMVKTIPSVFGDRKVVR